MRNDPFDLTSRPPVIGRIVGATIALVCVLIVYDGWAALELLDVVFIVVGPIVAFFTSHTFSSSLVQEVQLGRRPTMRERLAMARFESRFLLLASHRWASCSSSVSRMSHSPIQSKWSSGWRRCRSASGQAWRPGTQVCADDRSRSCSRSRVGPPRAWTSLGATSQSGYRSVERSPTA